jgi:aspartate racemase
LTDKLFCSGKGNFTLRKLGIVGGTNWSSTALYFDHINRDVAQRLGGRHSAALAIESLDPAPLSAMERSGDWAGVTRTLIECARRLKESGAEGLLIASNTRQKVHDDIAAAIDLPFLHIGEATAARIALDGRSPVALLGTHHTMTEGHIRDHIERRGVALAEIPAGWTEEVDRIIFEELALGRVVRDSQRKLKTLITELAKQKVQAIVLGCTELVFAVDVRANVIPVYDTTAIHSRAAVDWMLADEEEARVAA